MEHVLILLVMLTAVTHAFCFSFAESDTTCIAIQNTSCSVEVGRSVYIQVMTNAIDRTVWFKKLTSKGKVKVFTLNKEKVTSSEEFKNRTQFFIYNGTLEITNMERNDSGQYSVEVFLPNGLHVKHTFFYLDVQEHTFFPLRYILIIVGCAVVVLFIVVVSVVIYCKKSGSGKKQRRNTSF